MINYEKEPMKCPICNCEPKLTGFNDTPKKEVNNKMYDQVSIHCPGCGVTMIEGRRELEEENESIKRIVHKWNNRAKMESININELIDTVITARNIMVDLIGKQNEIAGILFGFSDKSVTAEMSIAEKHTKICNKIQSMDIKLALWRFIAVLELAIMVIYMTFFK